MKITRLAATRPLLSLTGLLAGSSGGVGPSGQVPTSSGSNSVAWGSNVAVITSNGSNALLGPFVNFASGSNITFAVASNTLTINSTSGGGSALTVKDEGSALSGDATTLDFVGAGVTASGTGGTKTITVSGGGGGSSPVGMLPIQDKYTNFGSTSSGAHTMGSTPTNGNILFLWSARDNGAAITSVTQTNVTWTQLAESTDTVAPKIELWKGDVAASASTSITVAYADATFSAVNVSEWPSTVPVTVGESKILAGASGSVGNYRITAKILPTDVDALVMGLVTTSSNASRYEPMVGLVPFDALATTTDAVFMAGYAFPGTAPVKGMAVGGGGTHGSLIVSLV
jgi:hypothetical protein